MGAQQGIPVLIAGAGTVVLVAAIYLTLKEYPVRIVESRSESSAYSKAVHRYNYMLGLPQSETERILEQRLSEHGVQVERDVKLEGVDQQSDSVTAYLTVECRIESCTVSI